MAGSFEIPRPVSVALQVVGGATCLALTLKLTRFVWQYYAPNLLANPAGGILSVKGIEQQVGALVAKDGGGGKRVVPWAIVTGASEGIGNAFAHDLARRGFSVVLIARNKARLDETASSIQAQYKNVSTYVISFDFGAADTQSYKKLFSELDKVASPTGEAFNFFAVLVNNVGICYDIPKPFTAVDIEEDLSILKINCEPVLQMTKYIIPKMTALRRGAIINLASFASLFRSPYLTTYSGTKAFDRSFSECINGELGGTGVVSVDATPSVVISRMSALGKDKRPLKQSFSVVPADEMARSTLDQINAGNPYKALLGGQGAVGPLYTTNGHANHALIAAALANLLPTSYANHYLTNQMTQISRRLHARLNKKQE